MSRFVTIAVALALCACTFAELGAQENAAQDNAPRTGGGLRAKVGGGSTGAGGGGLRGNDQGAAGAAPAMPAVAEVPDFAAILKQPVKFDFDQIALSEVADFFADHFDINVQLDSKGLADAAIDPSAPFTRTLRKPISFAAALHLIFGEFDLTFVVDNEVLLITSKEKADEILTTRVYPVGDLLGLKAVTIRPGKGISSPWVPLINLIRSTIQPDSWDDNGGPGSIEPFVVASRSSLARKWTFTKSWRTSSRNCAPSCHEAERSGGVHSDRDRGLQDRHGQSG